MYKWSPSNNKKKLNNIMCIIECVGNRRICKNSLHHIFRIIIKLHWVISKVNHCVPHLKEIAKDIAATQDRTNLTTIKFDVNAEVQF